VISLLVVSCVVESLLVGDVQFLIIADAITIPIDTIIIFVDNENISFEANLAT
jgi:hypothetical protein